MFPFAPLSLDDFARCDCGCELSDFCFAFPQRASEEMKAEESVEEEQKEQSFSFAHLANVPPTRTLVSKTNKSLALSWLLIRSWILHIV